MKRIFKAITGLIMFLLGADCETRREAASKDICNYGGQGKDRYGK